jgi:hypothetical protein
VIIREVVAGNVEDASIGCHCRRLDSQFIPERLGKRAVKSNVLRSFIGLAANLTDRRINDPFAK